MRALTLSLGLALLTLAACGEVTDVRLGAATPRQSALENGAAADAIIGQLSERGQTSSRTDAGSLNGVVGVAVGMGSSRLWIADSSNHRILGWPDTTALTSSANGADATLVLNQEDMFTIDFRNVATSPINQQLSPRGVAVDSAQRVYVFDASSVIAFEDPFDSRNDRIADYALSGVPADIRAVRALATNKLAVVGSSAVVFYELGLTDPYGEASLAPPCAGQVSDIARSGGVFFVSCTGPLLCSDGATSACSQIYVYSVDGTNGLPAHAPGAAPIAYQAYNDFVGITGIATTTQQQLVIADRDGQRVIRFDGVEAHANAVIGGTVGIVRKPGSTPADVPPAVSSLPIIYGQPNASSVVPNYYSATENRVSDVGFYAPSAVVVDPDDNRMWVADSGNSRVLGFGDVTGGTPVKTAQVVLGQLDMTHSWPNRLEPDALTYPVGVAVGPDSSGVLRAVVIDEFTHRALVFNNINSYVTGGDPTLVLGQSDARSYLDQGISPPALSLSSLSSPTYAAIAPNGAIYVTDAGNLRVLAFDTLGTTNRPAATRVFGAAANGLTAGVYGSLGSGGLSQLAATAGHLFVAAGNRVFMWEAATPRMKPIRVFGQDLTPGDPPVTDDIGNAENRGLGIARADTLSGVSGVAVSGTCPGAGCTLWVADAGNRRVLWFDDPTSSEATAATTADGVVGQKNFGSTAAYGGYGLSRYGFNTISSIAVAADGSLWVADSADSRVLVFFDPKTPNPDFGLPVASLVLGQKGFDANAANNSLNGVNATTLSSPTSVAVDSTGRTLLVADLGNMRALRFIDNQPPIVTGGGTYEVVAGTNKSVTLQVTDPENDPVTTSLVDPKPSGVTLSGNTVTYAAPASAAVGYVAHVIVAAADNGPRTQTTTVSVNFKVVPQLSVVSASTPPAARPAPSPSCACAGANPGWLVALALPLFFRRRRI